MIHRLTKAWKERKAKLLFLLEQRDETIKELKDELKSIRREYELDLREKEIELDTMRADLERKEGNIDQMLYENARSLHKELHDEKVMNALLLGQNKELRKQIPCKTTEPASS